MYYTLEDCCYLEAGWPSSQSAGLTTTTVNNLEDHHRLQVLYPPRLLLSGGKIAEWLERWTCNAEAPGLSPAPADGHTCKYIANWSAYCLSWNFLTCYVYLNYLFHVFARPHQPLCAINTAEGKLQSFIYFQLFFSKGKKTLICSYMYMQLFSHSTRGELENVGSIFSSCNPFDFNPCQPKPKRPI